MKLYRLSQNDNSGYDTYDSMVVAAKDETAARLIHPSGYTWDDGRWIAYRIDGTKFDAHDAHDGTWANSPEKVQVEYIGEAEETITEGTICTSFNAG